MCDVACHICHKCLILVEYFLVITESLNISGYFSITMKEVITIKGDRDVWLDFSIIVKRNKKEIWDILEPLLNKYITKHAHEGNRSTKKIL